MSHNIYIKQESDSLGNASEDAEILEILELLERGYEDRGIWAPVFDDCIFVICVLRYGSRTLNLTRVFDRLGRLSPHVAAQIDRIHGILNDDFPEGDLLRERKLAEEAARIQEANQAAEKQRICALARRVRREERQRWSSREVCSKTLSDLLAIDKAFGL